MKNYFFPAILILLATNFSMAQTQVTSVSPATGTGYNANNSGSFNFPLSYIVQAESTDNTAPQDDSFDELLVLTNRNTSFGQSFRTATIIGNDGNYQLRRSRDSSLGLRFSTDWRDTGGGAAHATGGFISFSPRDPGNANFPTERMRLTIDGRMGLGTTAPTEQLHTTSGVRFAGLTSTTNPARTIVSDANGKLFFVTGSPVTSTCTSANFIPRMSGTNTMSCSIIQQSDVLANCSGGTHQGIGINGAPTATGTSGMTCHNIILTVNGAALTTGQWIVSDKRIKKNIATIETGLDKVLQMRGVNYSFDNREFPEMDLSQGNTAGFIAQELQQIIPEAVSETEKGLHIVNYDAVIPYLVSALQEQNTVIEDQKKLMQDMAQRMLALEAKVNGQPAPQPTPQVPAPTHKLRVSPNPFGHNLEVAYNLEGNEKSANIRFKLSDANGKEVFSKTSQDVTGQFSIESSNLASGTYFLSFYVNGKLVETKQVVK